MLREDDRSLAEWIENPRGIAAAIMRANSEADRQDRHAALGYLLRLELRMTEQHAEECASPIRALLPQRSRPMTSVLDTQLGGSRKRLRANPGSVR